MVRVSWIEPKRYVPFCVSGKRRTAERQQVTELVIRQVLRTSRAERTRVELFLTGLAGWVARVKRLLG